MAPIRVGSTLIVVFALAITTCQVLAYTEEENFAFIDQILELLNDNSECHLPSYDEIDEVQKCFDGLEAALGDSFNEKLSKDQRLLKNTILYQWESFQKRMTSAVVIRSAKFRSFLCKVEEYQKAKFGSSVCTQIKASSKPHVDRVFEKNPIVRYIKHLETHDVPDPETASQVIHTPIEPETPEPAVVEELPVEPVAGESDKSTVIEDEQTPGAEAKAETESDKEENYDPLADVPVPPVEEESTPADSAPSDSEPAADLPPPSGSTSEPSPEPESVDESPPASQEPESTPNPVSPESEPATESSSVSPEPEPVPDSPEPTPEEPIIIVEEPPVEAKKPPAQEYVEEEDNYDDLDKLERLDRGEWDYDVRYGYFIWPDENPKKKQHHDGSIKSKWIHFLQEPFVCVVEEPVEKPPVEKFEPKPEVVKPSLRKRKKEFLGVVAADYAYQQNQKTFGWNNCKRDLNEPKPDHFVKVLDGNLCHLSINRNYKSQLLSVSGIKSLFSSKDNSSSRKRCLLS